MRDFQATNRDRTTAARSATLRATAPTKLALRALALTALTLTVLTLTLVSLTPTAFSQESALEARVPTSYANVHDAPSTASGLLLLVPEGTVLPVIGRQGEWVQVELSPELRDTGMIMRWYEGRHELIRRGEPITIGDEDSGWMHDSTVEVSEALAR
jgi:hypothetical protein